MAEIQVSLRHGLRSIWACLFVPWTEAGLWTGAEMVFFRRSTAVPCTIARALLLWCLGRSCIRWSFAPSSSLMSPERRWCRVEGWLFPAALRSSCFLLPSGERTPVPSCLFFLLVARSTRWTANRAPARLAGRPGRSLGGPARPRILPPSGREDLSAGGSAAETRPEEERPGCVRGRGPRGGGELTEKPEGGRDAGAARCGSVGRGRWVEGG